MTGRSPVLHDFAGRASRLATVKRRLRDPAVLTVVAVAFVVSAVGQALMQRYVHDASVVVIAVLSVFASVFLAAAVIVGARRHEPETRTVDRAMTTAPEKVRPSMPALGGSVYRPGGPPHRTDQGGAR